MERIVVLGGGVGGTLTANLLARRLHDAITLGQVDVTLVDAAGAHVYQPGFMYIAMGGEREEKLAPEAATWGRLLRENQVAAIHFAEHKELSAFECPEWSHLSADDSVAFTRRLLPHLRAALEKRPAPGPIAQAAIAVP